MRWGAAAKLIRLQLARDRRAALSSTFGIAVGVAALLFFVALGLGISALVRERIFPVDARLVEVVPSPVTLGVFGGALDEATVTRLRELPGVVAAHRKMSVRVPAVSFYDGDFFGRRLRMGVEILAVGVDPAFVRRDVALGAFEDAGPEEPVPALAATRLFEIYNKGFAPGRGLPQLSPAMVTGFQLPVDWNRSFVAATQAGPTVSQAAQIVGVSERGLLAGLTIPLEAARRLNRAAGADATNYSAIALEAANPADVPRIVSSVKEMGLVVDDSERRMAESVGAAVTLTTGALALLSGLICLLATFNIGHAISASVRARERELALLRAVGARRIDVFTLVFVQSLVLGLFGAMVGLISAGIATSLSDTAALALLPAFPFEPDTFFARPWWLVVVGLLVGALAAAGGAVLPAVRASRIDPARALAGQGP